MSAVPITITGILTTENGSGSATLVGIASITGLEVGGGPIVPDEKPPVIWGGGNVPMPTPPIANVPGAPGYRPPDRPPGIWGGGNEPFPTPPIHIPPMPIDPPPDGTPGDDGFIKSPPPGGGWGYHPTYGWMLDPKGAGPK